MAYDRSEKHKREMLDIIQKIFKGMEDGTVQPIETAKIEAGTIKTDTISIMDIKKALD